MKYVVHLLFDVLCHGKFSQLHLHSYLSNSYFEGFPLSKSLRTAKLLNLKDFCQICCSPTFDVLSRDVGP